MTVLVLGGYGAVGGHVVDQLRRSGDQAITAGRDPARAERVIDLTEPELNSYRAALTQVDTVVNASGAEDPRLAEVAATGVHYISMGALTHSATTLDLGLDF